jgi:hypothetical protein
MNRSVDAGPRQAADSLPAALVEEITDRLRAGLAVDAEEDIARRGGCGRGGQACTAAILLSRPSPDRE